MLSGVRQGHDPFDPLSRRHRQLEERGQHVEPDGTARPAGHPCGKEKERSSDGAGAKVHRERFCREPGDFFGVDGSWGTVCSCSKIF